MTDWLVCMCDECKHKHYVSVAKAATFKPNCGHELRLVGMANDSDLQAMMLRGLKRALTPDLARSRDDQP